MLGKEGRGGEGSCPWWKTKPNRKRILRVHAEFGRWLMIVCHRDGCWLDDWLAGWLLGMDGRTVDYVMMTFDEMEGRSVMTVER